MRSVCISPPLKANSNREYSTEDIPVIDCNLFRSRYVLNKQNRVNALGVQADANFSELEGYKDFSCDAISLDFGQKQGYFGGDGIRAEFAHYSRNWNFSAAYIDIGSGFRADYGFLPRVDVRTIDVQLHRTIWSNGAAWFNNFDFWLRGYRTSDHEGQMTDSRIALGGIYEGPLQSRAIVIGRLNQEFYKGMTYDVSDLVFIFGFKPAGGMSFDFEGNLARAIDYNNCRPASAVRFGPQMELGLGRHINLNVAHSLERLESRHLRTYTANLSQARLVYNFSVRAFLRAIVQYRDIARVPENYTYPVDARSRGLFTQFLFSYKINPRSVLFLGYSDNSLGSPGFDLTRTDRTFFLKIGYALGL